MKILHVDPEVRFGGGERQVAGLLRHLARRGYDNLLAGAPEGELARIVPPSDARFTPLSIRNDLDLLAAVRLARTISREQPDVVHFHTARAHKMSLWLAGSADRSIVTRRMDYPIRPGFLTDRLYNRRVVRVVAIAEEVRRMLLAAGVASERIRVIPSGVEPPAVAIEEAARRVARIALGIEPGDVVLAIVAALERRKGHDVLLRALARTSSRARILCLVCGSGSEANTLPKLAEALGLGKRVRFLGERRDVGDVLAASDLFVLPSRAEGLGVAILEAMATGLVIVASRVGGIPEAVVDGENGILVDPEDEAGLAVAVDRLAADPRERARMGEKGRERVLQTFTLERSADGYEQVYAEIRRLRRKAA